MKTMKFGTFVELVSFLSHNPQLNPEGLKIEILSLCHEVVVKRVAHTIPKGMVRVAHLVNTLEVVHQVGHFHIITDVRDQILIEAPDNMEDFEEVLAGQCFACEYCDYNTGKVYYSDLRMPTDLD